jgi:hypothetical protein
VFGLVVVLPRFQPNDYGTKMHLGQADKTSLLYRGVSHSGSRISLRTGSLGTEALLWLDC